MNKFDKVLTILLLLAVCFMLFFLILPRLARTGRLGTGSYRHARKWRNQLLECNSLDDVRQRFNCGRYQQNPGGSHTYIKDPNTIKKGNTWALLHECSNGDWIAVAYADSHSAPGGGTVVTRDSTGVIRVFFGHVCGKAFFRGDTLEEVYSCFQGSTWEEIFLNE